MTDNKVAKLEEEIKKLKLLIDEKDSEIKEQLRILEDSSRQKNIRVDVIKNRRMKHGKSRNENLEIFFMIP